MNVIFIYSGLFANAVLSASEEPKAISPCPALLQLIDIPINVERANTDTPWRGTASSKSSKGLVNLTLSTRVCRVLLLKRVVWYFEVGVWYFEEGGVVL